MSFPDHQTLPLLNFLLLLLLSPHAAAQIVDQAAIPACARGAGCAIWQQAQQLCAPPTTPAADKGCFCSSNYLAPFRAGQASGVCDVVCPPADQRALQAYFQGFCASPDAKAAAAAPAAPGGAAPTPPPGPAAAAATAAPAGGAAAAPAPVGGPETVTVTVEDAAPTSRGAPRPAPPTGVPVQHAYTAPAGPAPRSWIQSHYGWVVMVVVLLVAAALAVWGGLFLKRRRRRRPRAPAPPALAASDVAPALADRHPGARSGAPPVPPVPPAAWAAGAAPQLRPRESSASSSSARGFHVAGGGGGVGPFGPSASAFHAPLSPFGAGDAVPYSSEGLVMDPNRPNSRPGTSHR
jgi:hypothetical protein